MDALLTPQDEQQLQQYANILKQYVHPLIRQYSPIGWRKRPAVHVREAQRVCQERTILEARLGIAWNHAYAGHWKLEMVYEKPTEYDEMDLWYREFVPLNSARKNFLEYLAVQAFPKVFAKKFTVRDTMIPCDGDCSWDCA